MACVRACVRAGGRVCCRGTGRCGFVLGFGFFVFVVFFVFFVFFFFFFVVVLRGDPVLCCFWTNANKASIPVLRESVHIFYNMIVIKTDATNFIKSLCGEYILVWT